MYNTNGYTSLRGYSDRSNRRITFYITISLLILTIFGLFKHHNNRNSQKTFSKSRIQGYKKEEHKGEEYGKRKPSIIKEKINSEFHAPIPKKKHLVPFEATEEWKVIPENAALPAGLEIKIDLQTGEKMARRLPKKRTSSNGPKSLPEPSIDIVGRLDKIILSESEVQYVELEKLSKDLRNAHIGEMVTHAKNFENLLVLLDSSDLKIRIFLAKILESLFRDNPGTVEGAIMNNVVKHIIETLQHEKDPEVQLLLFDSLIQIVKYNGHGALSQFNEANGLRTINNLIPHETSNTSLFERLVSLLIEVSKVSHNTGDSYDILDKLLKLYHDVRPSNSIKKSLRPICKEIYNVKQHSNIVSYCRMVQQ